jgi:catechol 2,3-dioxygenase
MEAAAPPAPLVPAEVTLSVADLDRSVDFWERSIGLRLNDRSNGTARLGVPGRDLVVLEEQPGARPVRGGHTGLFHLALLVPDRRDLAAWLTHAAATGIRLTGASDHYVSEALYLRDPDSHGIEIYSDRPRETWTRESDGSLHMGTEALDLHDLMLAHDPARPFEGMEEGTRMGHIHLHVAHLPESRRFYADLLGLDLQVEIPGQASFLSSGGYHHHVGLNVWAGVGAPPPARDQAALRRAALEVSDRDEIDRIEARLSDAGHAPVREGDSLLVDDPSRNPLLVRPAGAASRA